MRESVIYKEIKAEGETEGIQKGIRQVAVNLLNEGMAAEQVARLTGLTVEQIQQLQAKKK